MEWAFIGTADVARMEQSCEAGAVTTDEATQVTPGVIAAGAAPSTLTRWTSAVAVTTSPAWTVQIKREVGAMMTICAEANEGTRARVRIKSTRFIRNTLLLRIRNTFVQSPE